MPHLIGMQRKTANIDIRVADACARALSPEEVEQWPANSERNGRTGLYATLRKRCLAAIATASLLLPAPAAHAGRLNEVVLGHSIHGGWQLPVTINKTLTIPFVLDTGSFSLQIPLDVYMVMIRQGTVTALDEREEVTIQTADGKSHKEKQFLIHEVKVGNKTLTDVLATISEPGTTDLLLGQSFLYRLGRYTIDNRQHTLTIEDGTEVAALPPQTPEPPISPPVPPSRADGARYRTTSCQSIVDRVTQLEWYVGPDLNTTWSDAKNWTRELSACGGKWTLPRMTQLRTLFTPDRTAGTGYYTRSRYWPAHIDPVFSQIGAGSWVWAEGSSDAQSAPAFNFNQGVGVRLSPITEEYTVRAFAVRHASE